MKAEFIVPEYINQSDIEQNKQDFLNILLPVVEKRDRYYANLENYLCQSDFFIAPASTKFHGNWDGGLCAHSLMVYYHMCNLVVSLGLEDEIPRESVVLVALLHDISKMSFYTPYAKNEKIYRPDGKKQDENGNFDWVSTRAFKVRDPEDRLLFGSHEENAVYMADSLVHLTREEKAAILHHMGPRMDDSLESKEDSSIYQHSKLVTLLHMADMLATFVSFV